MKHIMNRTCWFKEKKRHRERKMTMETLMKLACLVLALLMLCSVAVAEDKDYAGLGDER